MFKLSKCIFLALFIAFFCPGLIHAEEITITSYYPSPYGVYNALQTDKFAVGDNNGDGSFTSADVPTTPGEVWIDGNVGIGNGAVSPTATLDVNGTVKATVFQSGAAPGVTKTISITEDGGATCTIILTNGIYTGGTC
jgi:hypothetical protein